MSQAFTYREVHDILKLLRDAEHCESISLEIGETKIHLVRGGVGAPAVVSETPRQAPEKAIVAASPPAAPNRAAAHDELEADVIRAPMLGIFFRATSPEAPPFVEVGARIGADDTVCLIEVMKLFSPVQAGISGVIEEVLVENGTLVEHNQPLFRIRVD